MLEAGATADRVECDPVSAKALVQKIIPKPNVTIHPQEELLDGKTLLRTDAGAVINAEINKVRQELERKLEIAPTDERAKWEKKLDAAKIAQAKLETEIIALLPRQTRRWWQVIWRCLKGCGPVTENDGVWQCLDCHQR